MPASCRTFYVKRVVMITSGLWFFSLLDVGTSLRVGYMYIGTYAVNRAIGFHVKRGRSGRLYIPVWYSTPEIMPRNLGEIVQRRYREMSVL